MPEYPFALRLVWLVGVSDSDDLVTIHERTFLRPDGSIGLDYVIGRIYLDDSSLSFDIAERQAVNTANKISDSLRSKGNDQG
jgi:hypothetical protein